MKEKIAVLTDSGSDVISADYENLFVLPLIINVGDKSYIDGIDINLEEVFNLIDNYKITTSLPSPDIVLKTLDEIRSLGYTHVIINTISSGLSGTFNMIRIIASEYKGLEISLIDTKNISKASGYTTISALQMIKEGKSFAEINESLLANLNNNKVFFTVETLEYLRRGGRIGLVASTLANVLSIKPIISCNEEGIYYTAKKTRGYQRAIDKTIELVQNFIQGSKSFDLTLLVAKIDNKIKERIESIKSIFAKAVNFEVQSITPALAIHTGPNAIGIAIRRVNY